MKARALLFAAVFGLTVTYSLTAQQRQPDGDSERPVLGSNPPQEVHNHYYGGGGYGYGGGAGGFGYAGQGALQTGIGNKRLSTSQASENYAETAHMVQQNHEYAVNNYYANKEQHDAYVNAHRKGPPRRGGTAATR